MLGQCKVQYRLAGLTHLCQRPKGHSGLHATKGGQDMEIKAYRGREVAPEFSLVINANRGYNLAEVAEFMSRLKKAVTWVKGHDLESQEF